MSRPTATTSSATRSRSTLAGITQLHLVAAGPLADEINPQLAGAAVFANAPASGPDDQPITTHEALTNLPDGGAMVWVSPLGPIPSDTAVVDDRGYPPAPQLGTAES